MISDSISAHMYTGERARILSPSSNSFPLLTNPLPLSPRCLPPPPSFRHRREIEVRMAWTGMSRVLILHRKMSDTHRQVPLFLSSCVHTHTHTHTHTHIGRSTQEGNTQAGREGGVGQTVFVRESPAVDTFLYALSHQYCPSRICVCTYVSACGFHVCIVCMYLCICARMHTCM